MPKWKIRAYEEKQKKARGKWEQKRENRYHWNIYFDIFLCVYRWSQSIYSLVQSNKSKHTQHLKNSNNNNNETIFVCVRLRLACCTMLETKQKKTSKKICFFYTQFHGAMIFFSFTFHPCSRCILEQCLFCVYICLFLVATKHFYFSFFVLCSSNQLQRIACELATKWKIASTQIGRKINVEKYWFIQCRECDRFGVDS